MFIKSLLIATPNKIVREIEFHKGLNLIIDQTPDNERSTGNNVGKTTVLRLIDFCLGKDPKSLYQDPENKREVYTLVKNYLIDNRIIITLTLIDDFDSPTKIIEISRNFLSRKECICEIDGIKIPIGEFEDTLMSKIFPTITVNKPTFRQIISHNIRYDELRLTKTLKTLDNYTSDIVYETLHLFLFGCNYDNGDRREQLVSTIQSESAYKKRLERTKTRSDYKATIDVIDADIEKLNAKKQALNINPDLETDLNALNKIRAKINRISSDITSLNIKQEILNDTIQEIESQQFNEDLDQLRLIYQQASALVPNLQKTFEDLVDYHNKMLTNKKTFVEAELPEVERVIKEKRNSLNSLQDTEAELAEKVVRSDAFDDLEQVINELNDLHKRKGEYEAIMQQIDDISNTIEEKQGELSAIDNDLFAGGFQEVVNTQLTKFNKIFASVSEDIYDEKYAIKYETVERAGSRLYKFSTIDTNFSSGKKQGEISCFDIAYTIFADNEEIPCLHFLLNDKKELVHDNQLIKIAEMANANNIQFVASILEDKLPEALRDESYYIVKLSEDDKLFRIENEE
ncbi:MAG: DUF2326 domain-containing protein [Rikenellaceae bacterium]